ncbi:DUF2130 domain-containing protein [Ferruginibacter sp. HRS2-29]|uniref:DUF2130 domain-containing protein n=1 Tax=Ferruginibacter sp. HRS2-29 TaxID=2487334 RepID=UPI0020CF0D18|nr:DUF2130 domain-containing protein [Ferruginibacter sp. HRS2-29]MCP9749406.1 DUF2130 domain-containing protein [Ferruginibacter sp. HRS2-29]
MPNDIKCPNCGHEFDVENVLAADIEKKYQQKYQADLKRSLGKIDEEKKKLEAEQQLFEEKKKQENELFAQKIQKERLKLETEIQQQLTKSISSDYENRIRVLQENSNNTEEKLKEARKKELEFLQKEQELKNKEEELEITVQKKLQEERVTISEQIRQQELEKNNLRESEQQLRNKELEMRLEQQNKLIDEMKRKAEQSSMQRQGESQELLLEEILKENFPFDLIDEVGKGVEGADCIQTVRNSGGKECGKIIYESKRTKGWSSNWIDKLKADKRSRNADIAILVTQTFPKDMDRFGEKDGIWICNFTEVSSVSYLLRDGLLKIYEAEKREENKGDKMQMLYNYLTGVEFKGQVEAIAEGFIAMRNSITKERMQMEKLWKEREKQLEKVLLSTSGLYGSVKGIAGASVGDIPLLDGEEKINEIDY